MELIMFVGIPASGKSTQSSFYREMGYLVLSSDEIRETLLGGASLESQPEKERAGVHSKVYEVIRKRTMDALKKGQSVVVDATNLNRKRRMTFLDQFKKMNCIKKCVLFITNAQICIQRNRLRTGNARVPDEGMHHMLSCFECPNYWEGWDEIVPVVSDGEYKFPFDEIKGFDQHNPHHTLTLDMHMEKAALILKEQGASDSLIRAAQYHDIGKLYTKRFETMRGESTEHAHYFGHDNYGAYLYLTEMCLGKTLLPCEFNRILYEACLINCHMRPLANWKWHKDAKEKDSLLFGEQFMSDLIALNYADREAH